MIANKTYNGLDVDIWSCGVILFAMVCGYLPFEDSNTSALYKKILSGTYTLPEFVSDEFKDILEKVLEVDAVKRYKVQQILNHKWCSLSGPTKAAQGLIVGFHRMPIDSAVTDKMNKFGLDVEYSSKCIDANKHNHLTTTYYLLLKKTIKEGGSSSADLSSDSFDYESVQPFKRNEKSKPHNDHQKSEPKILDEGKVRIRPIRSFLQRSPHKNIGDLSSADINLASGKKSSDYLRIRKSGSSTEHYSTYLKMSKPDRSGVHVRKNLQQNLSTDTKRKTHYSINMRSQHRQSGYHHHSTCNQTQITEDNTMFLKQNDNSSTKMKPAKRKINYRRNYVLAEHAKSTEKQTQMRPNNGYYFKSRYI